MQADINFSMDANSVEKFLRVCREFPGSVEASMKESIKKTQRSLRRETVKELKKVTTLQPKYISKSVKSERIKQDGSHISGNLLVASSSLPLIRFEVNPQTPPRLKGIPIGRRRRLQYRLEKGGKTFSGDTPKHQQAMQNMGGSFSKAFTQHTKSGHIGVFFRHKETGKLMQAYGPNLKFFMHDDELLDNLRDRAHDKFMNEFPNEFRSLTGIQLGG